MLFPIPFIASTGKVDCISVDMSFDDWQIFCENASFPLKEADIASFREYEKWFESVVDDWTHYNSAKKLERYLQKIRKRRLRTKKRSDRRQLKKREKCLRKKIELQWTLHYSHNSEKFVAWFPWHVHNKDKYGGGSWYDTVSYEMTMDEWDRYWAISMAQGTRGWCCGWDNWDARDYIHVVVDLS